MTFRHTSSIACLAALFLWGCPFAKSGSGPKVAATQEDDFEDEDDGEVGIDQISGYIRNLNDAIRAKKFDAGSRYLRRAERGIQQASEITRSHPEFEDKEESVKRARVRFEDAVERDRIERRNAAIDELMRRGAKAVAKGAEIESELQVRVPSPDDVALLSGVLTELKEIQAEGVQYRDEARYVSHAGDRDQRVADFDALLDRVNWQLGLTGAIAGPIERGYAAVDRARTTNDGNVQLEALRAGASAFESCVDAIGAAEGRADFNPKLPVETKFGRKSVAETKKRCLDTGSKVRGQAEKLAWLQDITVLVAKVDRAVATLREAGSPSERLLASEDAGTALTECATRLTDLSKRPGYDRGMTFDTVFGKVTAVALERSCARERSQLADALPKWRWGKSFEAMTATLAPLKAEKEAAARAPSPEAAIVAWDNVHSKFEQCIGASRSLAQQPDTDAKYTSNTAFGALTVGGVLNLCTDEEGVSRTALEKAKQSKLLEDFVKNLQGDEVAVVRREGIPGEVRTLPEGRVLIYGKGKTAKHYDFNKKGERVDFAAMWKRDVEQVAAAMDEHLTAVERADTGATILAATKAAITQASKCHGALQSVEQRAGYDAGLRLTTKLGKLNAPGLREVCFVKKERLSDTVPEIEWRIQLEDAAGRARQAQDQARQAEQVGSAAARVKLYGVVLGGLTECIERTGSLATLPAANPKLTVATPFGKQTAAGLATACKKEKAGAERKLSTALADEKLEQFVATCRGDEVDVAEREGLPTRVEPVGRGRVFVYGAGRKAKRFAFDAQGTRTTEQVLSK